jgi:hypothetical protein
MARAIASQSRQDAETEGLRHTASRIMATP